MGEEREKQKVVGLRDDIRHGCNDDLPNLFCRGFEESDEVIPVLILLQTAKGHLGSWNKLLWVFEVFKQSILLPFDTLGLVGVGVLKSLDLTGVSSEETV